MAEKKNSPIKKTFFKIATLICAIVLAVSIGLMIRNYLTEKNAADTFEIMQTMTVTDGNPPDAPTPTAEPTKIPEAEETVKEVPDIDILAERSIPMPDKSFDWDAILAMNSDIYAWIFIPGTAVDYPILQDEADDTYYLEHNLDGSAGLPGCIYTEKANKKDFLDFCTLVYGHNMKDGTMFKTLHSYEDGGFFNDNRYMYIYLPDGTTYVYDIFSSAIFGNEHILETYLFEKEEQCEAYLSDLKNARNMVNYYRDGVNVTSKNHIVTLSTCVGTGEFQRLLISGVLINDPSMRGDEQLKNLYQEG